jgi:hypothetical protein
MFRVIEIKNANRHRIEDKIPSIPYPNLFKVWPFERAPMPYCSWVGEQFEMNSGYQSLSPDEQGHFLRLCLEMSRPGMYGRAENSLRIFEKSLGLSKKRSEALKSRLIEEGLLIKSFDDYDLIQPELREQCLLFLAGDKPMEKWPDLWKIESDAHDDSLPF